MNLQIRDPRAHDLARRLAELRGVSLTQAVVDALASELQRIPTDKPLAERLKAIADDLARHAEPGGRDLTRAEIDDLWGDG